MWPHLQDNTPEAVLNLTASFLPHLERMATKHGLLDTAHFLRMTMMEKQMNQHPRVEDIPDRDIEKGMMTIVSNTAEEAQRARMNNALNDDERNLDAAMADIVEVVKRHRTRMGRRICSPSDGRVIRQLFGVLRSMSSEASADADPSWGDQ
jgi:hypothetical protein